jgi:ATPase subunit of ABC transporter with duplicated ATPase domains
MASVKALQKRKEREAADMTEFPEYEEAVSIRMNEVTELPNGREVLDYRTDTLMSPSGKVLSRDVSLLVKGPEKICIIGRNGCGKSTLLKDMYENMKKSRSIIPFFMPQDYGEIMDMTVKPVDFLFPRASKDEITRAKTILGSMNYTSYEMEHSIKDLSGGQKAKLILVKISLSGANVLFLDEPTRNFSPLSGPEIRGLLRSFSGAIISVSHDRKYISEVCDKVYELNEQGLTRTELRL